MKKENKNVSGIPDNDKYYEFSTASATDCTGLMPTPPQTEEDEESYTDIYLIPRPKEKESKKLKQPNRNHQ